MSVGDTERYAVLPNVDSAVRHEFRKSGYSICNGNCVEVASLGDGGVVVRKSTRPDDVQIHFTAPEWQAFLLGVKAGEFDQT